METPMSSTSTTGLLGPQEQHHHYRSYHNLSPSDIHALTQILSHAPGADVGPNSSIYSSYVRITKEQIKALPAHLRSPKPHSLSLSRLHKSKDNNKLCQLHSALPPKILWEILNFIKTEVEEKVPAYLRSVTSAGPMRANLKSELDKLAPMWLLCQRLHGADPCTACILAQIGSGRDALVALRIALLARWRSGRVADGNSTRLVFLEAWIENLCEHARQTKEILDKSSELGRVLKELAKSAKRLGEAKHPQAGSGSSAGTEDAGGSSVGQCQDGQDHPESRSRSSSVSSFEGGSQVTKKDAEAWAEEYQRLLDPMRPPSSIYE
ncbi:uncharacterized protein K452DRAFT_297133 [Aplosporella prunicola CBS 121167]|uniref:Uncharacterized protein n=1 Tax=Aplosporella prunicola CBS 121167 TaxID=1176127 RepID=A0A6A6BGY1_9PEZI|nr:uncharacterized protein K452DRAFT_297133 [Aplosporella prunicola CBS 121167]KAF2143390.1 hypothetical protein K452DRAFT_297133 [Aplosporella prunicola CBS 121167]